MSNVNVTPQAVLLTSGQAATFEAKNSDQQPVSVSWSLNPPIGSLVVPAGPSPGAAAQVTGGRAPSATYVAPPLVASAQTIALIATTDNESASAMISLTPDAIAIVPSKVDLKASQSQQFAAIVAAAPTPNAASGAEIIWILSPPLGSMDQNGLYKAPDEIPDSTTIDVIAASPTRAKQAVATVNLASPPWQGGGVQILGTFLLLVFSLVFFVVELWPPALPSPDTARANRIEAERAVESVTTTFEKANTAKQVALSKWQVETKKAAQPSPTAGAKTEGDAPNVEAAEASYKIADEAAERAKKALDFASKDLDQKRDDEKTVNNPNVDTKLVKQINRELDLLWLVLLAGALGSFLHTAQSYSDYVGNRTLKSSWAWWYSFRPFIGAGLALVFYAAVRGGFMAIATGSNAKASELSPFGVISVAAMVGMFSKAATMKLGEVFDTVFKSDKAKESKDKLTGSSQTSGQSGGKPAGDGASTATK
jgi:hypothetical protein